LTAKKYITFGYTTKTFERAVVLVEQQIIWMRTVLDLNSSFSIRLGKKNEIAELFSRNNPYTAGYDLSINSAGKANDMFNGTKQSIVSSIIIPTGKWHNICVVY
jgi:hypothetical protein